MNEAVWVGFGLLSSVVALLIGTRFLTTLLPTSEYGKLALAISLAALAVQICGNPIGQTVTRFYAHWRDDGKLMGLLQDSGKCLSMAVGGILFVCLLVVLIGSLFARPLNLSFNLMTGFFAVLLVINRVAFGLEDAARERRFRGIVQGFFELSRFSFAVGLVLLLTQTNAETALSGFVWAAVLTVVIHGIFFRNLLKKSNRGQLIHKVAVSTEDATALKHFRLPLIMSNGCMWMIMMAERWALLRYGSLTDVGGYSAVYQLAFVPMLFVSSFLVLLTEPILYQKVGLDRKTYIASQPMQINRYLAIVILAMTLVAFCILYFFHYRIASIFLGSEFRLYSWIFPWLALAGGFFAASQQLLLKLSCEMRTRRLAALWGTVALFAIVSYFTGAMYWQLKGILIAVVVVNGFLLLLSIIYTGQKNQFYAQ